MSGYIESVKILDKNMIRRHRWGLLIVLLILIGPFGLLVLAFPIRYSLYLIRITFKDGSTEVLDDVSEGTLSRYKQSII